MMKLLHPYLIFPGTCKEALNYYTDCLGGEITNIQTFAESPMDVPDDQKDKIFNSVFQGDSLVFMASDALPQYQVQDGNNFSLFVTFSDMEEMQQAHQKLADGGREIMPVQGNFGMVMDRFGIQWMLSFDPQLKEHEQARK